jgi:hypothetical protein
MEFIYHKVDTLPKLAWCAVMKQHENITYIFHGSWVETKNDFFVEGVWEDDFNKGDFHKSYLFMGSGAKIIGEKITFCTPCHPMERLHILRKGSTLFISPSLVFIIQISNSELDISYIPYQIDLLNMVLRMDYHVGSIPLKDGSNIYIYHYRNIEIDSELNISITLKQDPPEFNDFSSYKMFLVRSITDIYNNANSDERFIKYKPITTLSSGYDSAAVSALLSEIGCCEDAVSLRTSRGGLNDSGALLGKKLGLNVTEYERNSVYQKEGFPEAEFVACGDLGQDFEMSAFENDFSQRLVFTGDQGDVLHDRLGRYNKDRYDIVMPEAGGCDLTEFRLRVGFIRVMPAFFAAKSQPSIYRISNSKEMKPWSLGNDYDRPIPRRIVEERGIARELFGIHKKAVSILLNTDKKLISKMKLTSLQSFESFYQNRKNERNKFKQFYWNIMFSIYCLFNRVLMKPNSFFQKRHIPLHLPNFVPNRFSQCPSRPSFLVHWGIATIKDRYKMSD